MQYLMMARPMSEPTGAKMHIHKVNWFLLLLNWLPILLSLADILLPKYLDPLIQIL
jgi:hypothetical protein